MGRVIVSHLAPADEVEIQFLCDIAQAFEGHGHECIIWSAIYDKTFAPYYLPLNWRIKEWPLYFRKDISVPSDEAYALIDRAKWGERIDQLAKQEWAGQSREELLDTIVGASFNLLNHLKPDLFLSWNTLCPHTGIAYDMCQKLGIHAALIERAVFPSTWFIEHGGLVGLSVLAGKDINECIALDKRDDYRRTGKQYLESVAFGKYNRYAQVQQSETMDMLKKEPWASLRPRVALFPPDDGSLGFVPANGPDRKATLPHYCSSFDAAKELSKAHEGITIFKPHPSFLERTFDTNGYPNLFVIDYDFREVMEWADVVASTATGLEFVAMSMDKPVLLMANDLMAGKRIAYEAQDPAQLKPALEQAAKRHEFVDRKNRFHEFVGYLMQDYLASPQNGDNHTRGPGAVVQDLCERYLKNTPKLSALTPYTEERSSILSRSWLNKLEVHTEAIRPQQPANENRPSRDKEELFQVLKDDDRSHVVLDFDYTLFKNNSSDLFISSLRPRLLAFVVIAMVDVFVKEMHRFRLCDFNRWRDYCRVVAATFLFPWSVVWWHVRAGSRMRQWLNNELLDAVLAQKPSQLTIVSYGFRHLIRPMVESLGLQDVQVNFVCSRIGPNLPNMHRIRKVNGLRPYLQPDQLSDSIFITDSEDDKELMKYIPESYLLTWGEYFGKPFHGFYFPLRYTVGGKYSRRRYLLNQLIKEDFLLLLLAYQLTPWSAAALPLLFISFMCIYEQGHFENDHKAAPREKAPMLSEDVATFSAYPIWKAWPWSFAFLATALVFLFPDQLGQFFTDPGAWSMTSPELAETLLPVGKAVAIWAGILLALRGLFYSFNRIGTQRRIFLFPFLHVAKVFSYALLLPLTQIGALILAAQVLVQTLFYNMYRHDAVTKDFNRQGYRMIILFVLLVPWLLTSTSPLDLILDWRFALILLWCGYRTLERALDKTLLVVALKSCVGAAREARRRARSLRHRLGKALS